MSEQTKPETALQSLAEKLRTDAIAIFGEGQAERDIIEWFYGALLAAAPATPAAQVAVPDVSAMAKVLSDRSADACNIDRTDNWAMYGQEYIEDVQAMLAAAPEHPAERQGGAAQSAPAGEREAFEAWWKLDAEGSENKAAAYEGWKARAAYAQGAPANEREGFRSWCESIGYPAALMTCGDLAAFQAGAAWQRTQAAGVPDVSAMARVLSDRSADACNIDRADSWALYGQDYIEDVRAMLAASTGQEVGK